MTVYCHQWAEAVFGAESKMQGKSLFQVRQKLIAGALIWHPYLIDCRC